MPGEQPVDQHAVVTVNGFATGLYSAAPARGPRQLSGISVPGGRAHSLMTIS